MASPMDYGQTVKTKSPSRLHYPPDTNAFLYYFMPPGKPRVAGELRLRLTSSDDPASFESGSDLLGLNGQAWSRPLPCLPKIYAPLYEKLREEGLVPDDLDRLSSTWALKKPSYRGWQRLFTLNDEFIVDFSRKESLHVITEQGTAFQYLATAFFDKRLESSPYTGAHSNRYLSLLLYWFFLVNL
jgi:hypothetical protein